MDEHFKERLKWEWEDWKEAAPDWYFLYLAVCGMIFVIVLLIAVA